MQTNTVIPKIEGKYFETSQVLAKSDARTNPTIYHKAQGMNNIYRQALGRQAGVNLGVCKGMLDEEQSMLTTMTEIAQIEKQQGAIIALKYIIALLEE